MKKICKNCRLYDPAEGVCKVTIIHEGSYYELPVLPNDPCHWLRMEKEIGCPIDIKQVRSWSDGEKAFWELPE